VDLFKPNVKKMKEKRDVPGLIKALSYKKSKIVRGEAAEALGYLHDSTAVDPLIAALKDNDVYVRCRAACALGYLHDSTAFDPLIAALKDNEWYVRGQAAKALGELKDPRAVEPLIAALKDHEGGAGEAALALGRIKDPSAVEPLLARLKDCKQGDWHLRNKLALALGDFKDQRAVEPLMVLLKDKNWEVRRSTAHALASLGWKPCQDETGAAYWAVLEQWDKCVAMGTLAVDPLIIALNYYISSRTRMELAMALGQLKEPRAIEPLIAALQNEISDDARLVMKEALAKIRDQRAGESDEKGSPSSIEGIMRQLGFSYYFLLTFSSENEAKIFWERITSRQDPPVRTVLLWGSWISLDFGNVQRWFVAWLTDGQSYSNSIDRWWHTFRPEDTPVGAGYGSPSSPLGVRMKIDKVYEEKKLRCT